MPVININGMHVECPVNAINSFAHKYHKEMNRNRNNTHLLSNKFSIGLNGTKEGNLSHRRVTSIGTFIRILGVHVPVHEIEYNNYLEKINQLFESIEREDCKSIETFIKSYLCAELFHKDLLNILANHNINVVSNDSYYDDNE